MVNLKRGIIALLLLFTVFIGYSQSVPDPMVPARLVNDFSGILSKEQSNVLEERLRAFNTKTSTQVVVVTVNDLAGMAISQFATELGHKWGVGKDGKDNGVILLVKPKTSDSKGEVFIAVGYGLEGALPDITAQRVISQEIIPSFKSNDIYGGIDKGTSVIMGLVSGEYTAEEYEKQSNDGVAIGLIILFIIFIIISVTSKPKHIDMNQSGGKVGGGMFMPPIFLGGSRGSDFGSFSSGGGGFGGFGGGGFGGGGAGGSW